MENFFTICSSINQIEAKELLFRRYSNIEYILNMDIDSGYEFVIEAYKKENEDTLWQMYLVDYSHMNKDNYMNFIQYKEKIMPKPIDRSLSKEEILNKSKAILEKLSKKKEGEK